MVFIVNYCKCNMFFSMKAQYAIMAMLHLAGSAEASMIKLSEIASHQNIPHGYLEHIFAALKSKKLIASHKGPKGGYTLAMSAQQITISCILQAVESDARLTRCIDDNLYNGCLDNNTKCNMHSLLSNLNEYTTLYLSNISLYDVLNGAEQKNDHTSQSTVYMDYNATGIPHTNAIEEALLAMRSPYNPSAIHHVGRKARSILESCRSDALESCNKNLGLKDFDITFTSSGTESNNLALSNAEILIASAIEHPSVLNTNDNRIVTPVSNTGVIDLYALEEFISQYSNSTIAVMLANNETGVIQPITEVDAICTKYGCQLHVDASHGFAKLKFDLSQCNSIRTITISSHKIGGILGAAGLLWRNGHKLSPIIKGGGQENNLRSSTENIPAIVAFAEAMRCAKKSIQDMEQVRELRDELELKAKRFGAIVFGSENDRTPNVSSMCIPDIKKEILVAHFDNHGIAISAGSACSSNRTQSVSHVLSAMGINEELQENTVRISLGTHNKCEDVGRFIHALQEIIARMDKI